MLVDIVYGGDWRRRLVAVDRVGSAALIEAPDYYRAVSQLRAEGKLDADPHSSLILNILQDSLASGPQGSDAIPAAIRDELRSALTRMNFQSSQSALVTQHVEWHPGDGWGIASLVNSFDGHDDLVGEYYPQSDWNLQAKRSVVLVADLTPEQQQRLRHFWITASKNAPAHGLYSLVYGVRATTFEIVYLGWTPRTLTCTEKLDTLHSVIGRRLWASLATDNLSLQRKQVKLDEGEVAVASGRPCVGGVEGARVRIGDAHLNSIAAGERYALLLDTTGPSIVDSLPPSVAAVLLRQPSASGHLAYLLDARGVILIDSLREHGPQYLSDGDRVVIDGHSGKIYPGTVRISRLRPPVGLLNALAQAESESDGPVVLVNAESEMSASLAASHGAAGVGLLRTEHLFRDTEGAALLREIMSGSYSALARFTSRLATSVEEIALHFPDMPVNVRFLEAPMHEFDPAWREANPMMGQRGVRLLIAKPALIDAHLEALDAVASKTHAKLSLTLPMLNSVEEFAFVRNHLARTRSSHTLGAMLETPRAILLARELADAGASHFSIGTNDLTQFAYALSRDDAGPILETYLDRRILPVDPFIQFDRAVLGRLLQAEIARVLAKQRNLRFIVCGNHAVDEESLRYFVACGVHGVSVPPSTVLKTRLMAQRPVCNE